MEKNHAFELLCKYLLIILKTEGEMGMDKSEFLCEQVLVFKFLYPCSDDNQGK